MMFVAMVLWCSVHCCSVSLITRLWSKDLIYAFAVHETNYRYAYVLRWFLANNSSFDMALQQENVWNWKKFTRSI